MLPADLTAGTVCCVPDPGAERSRSPTSKRCAGFHSSFCPACSAKSSSTITNFLSSAPPSRSSYPHLPRWTSRTFPIACMGLRRSLSPMTAQGFRLDRPSGAVSGTAVRLAVEHAISWMLSRRRQRLQRTPRCRQSRRSACRTGVWASLSSDRVFPRWDQPLFRNLRAQGTYFIGSNPRTDFGCFSMRPRQRARAHPAPYAHWYIDGGAAADHDPALTAISSVRLIPSARLC